MNKLRSILLSGVQGFAGKSKAAASPAFPGKISFLVLMLILAGVSGLFAQNCRDFYFLQNNKTIEMATYNKKGSETGRNSYTVNNVTESGGTTTADVTSEVFDKKGKSVAKSEARIKCTGGAIMIDMQFSMPQQQQAAIRDAKMSSDDIFIEYPNSMKAGDQLKDASMNVELTTSGIPQTIEMEVFDRKVEAEEKITTPAGSWDSFRISSKTKVRIKTAGIGIPVNVESTDWFVPGFGIVKTESKHGYTQIVSIK